MCAQFRAPGVILFESLDSKSIEWYFFISTDNMRFCLTTSCLSKKLNFRFCLMCLSKKTLKFRFCLMTLRLSKKLNFRFCLMTSCLCSGIICACGMGEWSVECECVCRWMVSGWNEGDCVEQAPALGPMQRRLKTELFSVAMRHIYICIYTTIGVSERQTREMRERREE